MSGPSRRLVVLALFSTLVFLATGEWASRLTSADFMILSPLLYYQGVDIPVHRESSSVALLYELKPSTSASFGDRVVTTNALGFRDKERSARKPPGVFRILCLGSSNTYGASVGGTETYPARLEELLNRGRPGRPRFEVWNMGVSAYTLRQSATAAEEAVRRYEPDLLVIQTHSTNRRAFLLGRPFARYFEEDPSLYAENLHFLPFGPSGLGEALLRRWRFYRTLVIYANHWVARPLDYQHEPNLGVPRRLLQELGRRVPVVMLYNPRSEELLPELKLKSVFLEKHLPADFSADHMMIHPPAYVYRWYAQVLARELPLPR